MFNIETITLIPADVSEWDQFTAQTKSHAEGLLMSSHTDTAHRLGLVQSQISKGPVGAH